MNPGLWHATRLAPHNSTPFPAVPFLLLAPPWSARAQFIADNASRVKVKKGAELPPPPPILLHCSAGVGRTGTFVAIAHGMEHLKTAGSASPLKIVRTIRQDRMALVQHPKQFEFVHASLVRWAQMCHADYVVAKPKLQGKKAKFTAEEAVTQRGLEKSQAKVRLQETMKSGQKLKRRSSALRMKAIKDKSTGTAIQFQEDDSTGEMPKAAAIQQVRCCLGVGLTSGSSLSRGLCYDVASVALPLGNRLRIHRRCG